MTRGLKIIVVCILIALASPLAHAQARELQSIEEAARASNWKRAEELSRAFLKRYPTHESVAYILTLSQLRLGGFDRALVSARRLREIDTVRIQPWLMISECELALNRGRDAISTLSTARVKFPDSVQIAWALGMALVRSGRFDEAIDPLEEAMYRRPDVPSITEQLATCYLATGRYSESADLFASVLELAPRNGKAWLKYGESLLALRRLDSARTAFLTVIELQPDSAPAYLALTAILTERGQSDSARAVARTLTQRRPSDPQAWYNRGLLALAAKQADSAMTFFRRAISLQPSYPEAYFNLALAYEDQGFMEDAAVALQRCALMSPVMAPDAYNSLAIIYRRDGRIDEAIAAHAQAISLRDTSSVFHASRLNTLFEAQRCEQALPFIEADRRRFPTSAEIQYACARCYIRLGRREDALAIEQYLTTHAPMLAEQLRLMMK